ncbi:MAG: integration host factor subunit beta [Pelagibacteraceae bacterium]|nr:integration host factor subunit beta [Pelagibacteraceae bacterium]|tara:strand:- start:7981 stop:8268 length:288 start_codon:yes stop_codon:yes gene_type:complete
MLKSHLILKLQDKNKNLSITDLELVLKIFLKKITNGLKENNNVELRGFGTISKKENKEKYVRNPKTNEKIFKNKNYKIHFKIGKILHKKLNSTNI